MSDCGRVSRINGEKSILYTRVLSITNDEDESGEVHDLIYTDDFYELFGDFVNEPDSMRDRLDENGEPRLFLNKRLNKWYIKDINNQQYYFPENQNGLKNFFSTNEIKEFSKSLAYAYYSSEVTIDKKTGEVIVTDDITLKEHVNDFVLKKIEKLHQSEDFDANMLANSLEGSLDHLDEWVESVRNFFKSVKLDNRLVEKEEFIENEESANDEVMRKESFLKSSKESITNNVKLYLSLIPNQTFDKDGNLVYKKNAFGEETFVGFDEIYTVLNNALRDITPTYDENGQMEDEFDIYLEEIAKLIPFKPYLQKVYNDLTSNQYTENEKNQFTQAFRLVKNNFLGSELTITEVDGVRHINYTVKNLSDVSSRKSNIIQQWKFNFDATNVVKKLDQQILVSKTYQDKYAARSINPTDKEISTAISELKKTLAKIGVLFTEQGLNRYLYEGQLNPPSNDVLMQKLISSFDGINRELKMAKENGGETLFEFQGMFKELAEAEAFFVEEGSDATIFSVGKTKWVYSRASFLSQQINKWKRNPNLLIQKYESNDQKKSSLWMEYLTAAEFAHDNKARVEESRRRLFNVAVNIFNSVQTKGDALDAVDNKSITDTDALNDYLHKLLGSRVGNGKTYHKTALAADKSTEFQLFFGNDPNYFSLLTNAYVREGKIRVSNKIVDIFFNYFNGEYKRMRFEHDFVAIEANKSLLKQNYHLGNKNAFKSQIFPSLSINFGKGGKVIQPDIDFDLYDEHGVPIYDDLNDVKAKVAPLIHDALSNIIHKTQDTLIDKQLIKFDNNGQMYNNGFDSALFAAMQQDGSVEHALVKIAADTSVNSLISQIEFSKMFTGDTAYYKNIDDYLKRVPETYTDGQYGRFPKDEQTFDVAVISGVVISPDSLEAMKEYLPAEIIDKYAGKVNSTDGQAWISPERWKSIMLALGKPEYLVQSTYDKMYKKNAKFSEKEKKLLSTILKGVHYEETADNVPVFLKYSQAVIIPSMVKGTGLEILLNKMKATPTENGRGIDELITIDGMKVGSFKPVQTHDENGNVISDFELQPLSLRNEFWKLQQDLPVKGSKQTDVGSQIMQVAFAGLAYEPEVGIKLFELEDGTILDKNDMQGYLNNIFNAMTHNGMKGVVKDLGLSSLDSENPLQFKDEDKIFNLIIDQMSSRKDVTSNYLKALESHTSPYGIPGAKEMFHNVFNAYITDRIVKVKTNGGGFIQMSDYGLSFDEATKESSGIKLAPWFSESKLPTPKKIGINPKTGKMIIQPGGVFISSSIISKYIPDWASYSSEELFGTLNEDTGKYEDGMIDPEILQNIIGYRIPTQGLGSADALMVMGILPDTSADTIIPYTGITTKTGSDFDIDKMYLMIPSFRPSYNVDMASVYNFIKDEVHQKNVQESILYIQDLLRELNIDSDDLANQGFDINEFYEKSKNRSYISKTISQSDRALTLALINDSNREHPLVKKMFEQYNIKTTSLNYIKPNHKERDVNIMGEMPIEVLQNKLISAYKSIFTNQDVMPEIMNPIDFPHIQADVKNLNGVEPTEDLAAFNGIAQVKTKSEFMKGKAGLGQNVNSLNDSIRGSMADLYLINTAIGQGHTNEALETVFDKQSSVSLSKAEMEFYVKDFNQKGNWKEGDDEFMTIEKIQAMQNLKLNESMTALINAFVDIVKDQYIVTGNWTTITNNIGFMMLRAGVHPFVVTSFLAQPVLKNYVAFVTNMESNVIDKTNKILQEFKLKYIFDSISPDETLDLDVEGETVSLNKRDVFRRAFTVDSIDSFDDPKMPFYENNKLNFMKSTLPKKLAEIFGIEKEEVTVSRKGKKVVTKRVPDEYFGQLTDMSYLLVNSFEDVFEAKADIKFKDMSLIDLRSQIDEQTPEFQTAVLNTFIEFQDLAKNLTKNVKASKISVEGPGKNISSLVIFSNMINELLANQEPGELGGFETKLVNRKVNNLGEEVETDTMFKSVLDYGINFTYQVMRANPKFFLTADDSVVSTFNEISNMLYGNTLQSEKLADKLDKGFYSYIMSGFKPLQMDNDDKRGLLLGMPKRLEKIKRRYADNALLKALYPREGESVRLGRNEEEYKDKDFYTKHYISLPNLKISTSQQDDLVDGWAELFREEPEFANDLVKYTYLTTGFNNNINAFFQKIPAEWFNRNRFNSYLINSRNRDSGLYEDFIDQFFRNNHFDNAIARRTWLKLKKAKPGTEGEFSNLIEGTPSYVAFKQETNKGYLLYTQNKEGHKAYYKLLGTNPEGHFIYVRTSILGSKDAKGNRIVEYSIGDTFSESVLDVNRITMTENSLEAWTNLYLDENINRVVKASPTFGGIKIKANKSINYLLLNKVNTAEPDTAIESRNEIRDIDVNHYYDDYTGFDELISNANVKATGKGDMLIDGEKYKAVYPDRVEIREKDGIESLLFYTSDEKQYAVLVGTRAKGKENFKTLPEFYHNRAKEVKIQEAQPSILDKEADVVIFKTNSIITRGIVKSDPNILYLFGDNDLRKGLGGQAKEMRGEPNTVGISTKKIPSNDPGSFKTDDELEENKRIITEDINKAIEEFKSGKYYKLVMPPIGVGLAKLEEKAPKTWEFLQQEFNRLESEIESMDLVSANWDYHGDTLQSKDTTLTKETFENMPQAERDNLIKCHGRR